jgi:hypothetical protein
MILGVLIFKVFGFKGIDLRASPFKASGFCYASICNIQHNNALDVIAKNVLT